jgi:photosystem II stability/assembly factor-like uncharacterized protein
MRGILMLLAAVTVVAQPVKPESWKIQYQFDKDRQSLSIDDIMFVSRDRGIAVGTVSKEGDKKPEGLALVTRDGGVKWTPVPLKEPAGSVFLVNESVGYMATQGGIWKTQESGLSWRKLKNVKGVEGIYFLTERHGWAFGAQKLMIETKDGGATWEDVPAAAAVKANPQYTVYRWMQFVTPTRGMAGGTAIPPRPNDFRSEFPSWIDPESASKRREWPTLSIGLDTSDAGEEWKLQTAPVFGVPVRLRFGDETRGLGLIRFENAFDYPSEVYLIAPKTGKSIRTFRDKKRIVTDVGWLTPERAVLVVIEPQGSPLLPIPGRLHVLESDDFTEWTEMPVAWKAYAKEAVFAAYGGRAWIGTDTGMILALTQ